MNFYINLKKLAINKAEYYETGDENKLKDIERYTNMIFEMMKPKEMNEGDSKSYINEFDISFEKMCHSLQQNYSGTKVKSLTVQEFYSLVELLEEKSKPNK